MIEPLRRPRVGEMIVYTLFGGSSTRVVSGYRRF